MFSSPPTVIPQFITKTPYFGNDTPRNESEARTANAVNCEKSITYPKVKLAIQQAQTDKVNPAFGFTLVPTRDISVSNRVFHAAPKHVLYALDAPDTDHVYVGFGKRIHFVEFELRGVLITPVYTTDPVTLPLAYKPIHGVYPTEIDTIPFVVPSLKVPRFRKPMRSYHGPTVPRYVKPAKYGYTCEFTDFVPYDRTITPLSKIHKRSIRSIAKGNFKSVPPVYAVPKTTMAAIEYMTKILVDHGLSYDVLCDTSFFFRKSHLHAAVFNVLAETYPRMQAIFEFCKVLYTQQRQSKVNNLIRAHTSMKFKKTKTGMKNLHKTFDRATHNLSIKGRITQESLIERIKGFCAGVRCGWKTASIISDSASFIDGIRSKLGDLFKPVFDYLDRNPEFLRMLKTVSIIVAAYFVLLLIAKVAGPDNIKLAVRVLSALTGAASLGYLLYAIWTGPETRFVREADGIPDFISEALTEAKKHVGYPDKSADSAFWDVLKKTSIVNSALSTGERLFRYAEAIHAWVYEAIYGYPFSESANPMALQEYRTIMSESAQLLESSTDPVKLQDTQYSNSLSHLMVRCCNWRSAYETTHPIISPRIETRYRTLADLMHKCHTQRAQLGRDDPLAIMLVGPSGAGKSELAAASFKAMIEHDHGTSVDYRNYFAAYNASDAYFETYRYHKFALMEEFGSSLNEATNAKSSTALLNYISRNPTNVIKAALAEKEMPMVATRFFVTMMLSANGDKITVNHKNFQLTNTYSIFRRCLVFWVDRNEKNEVCIQPVAVTSGLSETAELTIDRKVTMTPAQFIASALKKHCATSGSRSNPYATLQIGAPDPNFDSAFTMGNRVYKNPNADVAPPTVQERRTRFKKNGKLRFRFQDHDYRFVNLQGVTFININVDLWVPVSAKRWETYFPIPEFSQLAELIRLTDDYVVYSIDGKTIDIRLDALPLIDFDTDINYVRRENDLIVLNPLRLLPSNPSEDYMNYLSHELMFTDDSGSEVSSSSSLSEADIVAFEEKSFDNAFMAKFKYPFDYKRFNDVEEDMDYQSTNWLRKPTDSDVWLNSAKFDRPRYLLGSVDGFPEFNHTYGHLVSDRYVTLHQPNFPRVDPYLSWLKVNFTYKGNADVVEFKNGQWQQDKTPLYYVDNSEHAPWMTQGFDPSCAYHFNRQHEIYMLYSGIFVKLTPEMATHPYKWVLRSPLVITAILSIIVLAMFVPPAVIWAKESTPYAFDLPKKATDIPKPVLNLDKMETLSRSLFKQNGRTSAGCFDNQVFVRAYSGDYSCTGSAIFYKGRSMITASHVIPKDVSRIDIVIRGQTFIYYDGVSVQRDKDSDLAFLHFSTKDSRGVTLNEFADISSSFLPADKLAGSFDAGHILHRSEEDKMTIYSFSRAKYWPGNSALFARYETAMIDRTKSGVSGAPVYVGKHDNASIIGLHVGRYLDEYDRVGIVVPVAREFLQGGVKLESDESIPGTLMSTRVSYGSHLSKGSKIVPTVMQQVAAPTKIPARMTSYMWKGVKVSPLSDHFKKFETHERNVGDTSFVAPMVMQFFPQERPDSLFFSLFEAINGSTGMDRMAMDGSPGYPYCLSQLPPQYKWLITAPGYKRPQCKKDCFDWDGVAYTLKPWALQVVIQQLNDDDMVYVAFPKDETLSIIDNDGERNRPKDTRYVYTAPLSVLLVERMIMGPFVGKMFLSPDKSVSSVGINAHSLHWAQLYKRLSNHPNANDFDFKAMDIHNREQSWDTFMEAYKLYVNEPNLQAKAHAHIEFQLKHTMDSVRCTKPVFKALHITILYGNVLMTVIRNGSGSFLTALKNLAAILEITCVAVINSYEPGMDDILLDISAFIELATYGDDTLITFHDRLKNALCATNFVKVAYELGYIATDAAKSEVMSEFKNLDDCTFIKRSFVSRGGWMYAPLDQKSIHNMLLWVREPQSEADFFESAMNSYATENAHYPDGQKAVNVACAFLRDHKFDIRTPSLDAIRASWRS